MSHLLGLMLWSMTVFSPSVTLEQAVIQTPGVSGPYYFSYRLTDAQVYSSAIRVTDDDYQKIYDATWKRMAETATRLGIIPDRKVWEDGCWDRHDCPPIYVTRVGDDEGQADSFFSVPATATLDASIADDGARRIDQTLVWSQTVESGAFVSALMLNRSSESSVGAGTFLDDASDMFFRPAYDPVVVGPGDFYVQTRLGDLDYELRFGVGLLDMNHMEAGVSYFIIWETPPGTDARDNAKWEFAGGNTFIPGCCAVLHTRCWVTADEWGVGIIEDGARLVYHSADHCYRSLFAPFIITR